VILLFPLFTLAASGIDIRVNPKDYVYICEANADRGYFNAMIHNAAFINRSEDTVTPDHATIDVVMDKKRGGTTSFFIRTNYNFQNYKPNGIHAIMLQCNY
jgi:hypothetical protein